MPLPLYPAIRAIRALSSTAARTQYLFPIARHHLARPRVPLEQTQIQHPTLRSKPCPRLRRRAAGIQSSQLLLPQLSIDPLELLACLGLTGLLALHLCRTASHKHTSARLHAHTHAHTHTRTHARTHTHIHTQTNTHSPGDRKNALDKTQ